MFQENIGLGGGKIEAASVIILGVGFGAGADFDGQIAELIGVFEAGGAGGPEDGKADFNLMSGVIWHYTPVKYFLGVN